MKALLFPVFLYGQSVQVHTPTPDMVFYGCPSVGRVYAYGEDEGENFCTRDCPETSGPKLFYWVDFECVEHVVNGRFYGDNLRLALPKKKGLERK